MQGLVSYSDDSDDNHNASNSVSGRHDRTNGRKERHAVSQTPEQRLRSPASTSTSSPSGKAPSKKHIAGIRLNTRPYLAASTPSPGAIGEQAVASSSKLSSDPTSATDNITQIPQQSLPGDLKRSSEVVAGSSNANGKGKDSEQTRFDGMSEEEIFREITRPKELDGKNDWGIPPLTDEQPSPALTAKVANFLQMKQKQNMHINTTLLSSTAFANPHIYAKLVEFVDIDERGSAYPGGGWLTRRDLERRIPDWGKKAIADAQKAAADAVTASQAPGMRSNISFTSGSGQARSGDRDRGHPSRSDRHRPVREGLDRRDGGSVGSNGSNIGSRRDEYRSRHSHGDPRRERSAAKWDR